MLIKVRIDGELSGWQPHTGKAHKEMMSNPPQSVVIQIGDFFEDGPDVNVEVEIDFQLFDVIARQFTLLKKRQKMKDTRHLVAKSLNGLFPHGDVKGGDVEEDYFLAEFNERYCKGLQSLTPTQLRRFLYWFQDGWSIRRIAHWEGVDWTAVRQSIDESKEKMKQIFD